MLGAQSSYGGHCDFLNLNLFDLNICLGVLLLSYCETREPAAQCEFTEGAWFRDGRACDFSPPAGWICELQPEGFHLAFQVMRTNPQVVSPLLRIGFVVFSDKL